ncbi:uncharacterized protein LOC122574022 isoform X3 [Bombus pyrosoma]|uniref:uncharacterized protein LOC122574022 isoform X3 n=1 Tax=Bombus pyrosoma TaxID=396416 RepID=UPI001CB94358|nr:uncharacterized protein LOC122574022 isoform X3 [Bombus pyrosoma]
MIRKICAFRWRSISILYTYVWKFQTTLVTQIRRARLQTCNIHRPNKRFRWCAFHRRQDVNPREKKRWREAYAKETNFRHVHPFLLQKYSPHFRGQETGPAITHSCICHELNLEIVHTFTDFVSLEQQVSLMNDYWKKAPRGITQA